MHVLGSCMLSPELESFGLSSEKGKAQLLLGQTRLESPLC